MEVVRQRSHRHETGTVPDNQATRIDTRLTQQGDRLNKGVHALVIINGGHTPDPQGRRHTKSFAARPYVADIEEVHGHSVWCDEDPRRVNAAGDDRISHASTQRCHDIRGEEDIGVSLLQEPEGIDLPGVLTAVAGQPRVLEEAAGLVRHGYPSATTHLTCCCCVDLVGRGVQDVGKQPIHQIAEESGVHRRQAFLRRHDERKETVIRHPIEDLRVIRTKVTMGHRIARSRDNPCIPPQITLCTGDAMSTNR
mgnify:CR=1 FL=1